MSAMIARVEVVAAEPPFPGALLLVPLGMASGIGSVAGVQFAGARLVETLCEVETGQRAALLAPEGPAPIRLLYRFEAARHAPRWPEAAFQHRPSRYTEAAGPLVEASRAISAAAGGGAAGMEALVAEARARFTYAHAEVTFNEGHDSVPHLGCGVAPGSCIDINTCLVASLRAAGHEAAYLAGYFFPAEKGGHTVDMHCWIATRHGDEVLEWDVAHHMKAGLDPVRPGLNPKPGRLVALATA